MREAVRGRAIVSVRERKRRERKCIYVFVAIFFLSDSWLSPHCLHLFFLTPHSYSSLALSFSCPLYCFPLLRYSHTCPRSAFPISLNTVFVCVRACVSVCVRFVFRFLWVIFVSFVFLNGASVCHVQKSRGRCRLCVPLVPSLH
jgi:hypothetical protein